MRYAIDRLEFLSIQAQDFIEETNYEFSKQ